MPTINELNQNQPGVTTIRQRKRSDRHADTQQQAQNLKQSASNSLVNPHQQRMERLASALEKAEDKRDETLEVLSDRMAYLQDGEVFMVELMNRTSQKLKAKTNPKPISDKQVDVIEGLIDGFDALGEWEYPALMPYSAAGCLPM